MFFLMVFAHYDATSGFLDNPPGSVALTTLAAGRGKKDMEFVTADSYPQKRTTETGKAFP